MGSVLSLTFRDFYMSNLENKIFNDIKRPHIYVRYVDDILILSDNIEEIKKSQQTFQNNSVLKFTYELNMNYKIPFLDANNNFNTCEYKKHTSNKLCILNYKSECQHWYKIASKKIC